MRHGTSRVAKLAWSCPDQEKPTMTPEKIEKFRVMANSWLNEAQRTPLSPHIRANAAFDAVYMYCRVVLAGTDEKLEHPHQEVLTGAAERLGWSHQVMTTATQHLDEWYSPFRGESRYDSLLALALRLKAVVSNDIQNPHSK